MQVLTAVQATQLVSVQDTQAKEVPSKYWLRLQPVDTQVFEPVRTLLFTQLRQLLMELPLQV